ncbi:hypothetical protein RHOSPDRAFT_32642 [Rhodotorula sp. JG-1b]|nr:hypothetical protein RHOSPDRAFT_32642 [Rhodotorula sp. JG-1b]
MEKNEAASLFCAHWPKGRGRHAIVQSGEENFGDDRLHVNYCLCGEFILVVDAPLSACPRRPTDGSFALVNTGSNPRTYKLNVSEQGKDLVAPSTLPGAPAAGAAGKYGNGVLVNREGGFEFQSALSDVQNKVPSEAFGEPAVTPAGPVATEPSPTAPAATATA